MILFCLQKALGYPWDHGVPFPIPSEVIFAMQLDFVMTLVLSLILVMTRVREG